MPDTVFDDGDLVENVFCLRCFRISSLLCIVGGSHQEDMTVGRSVSWTLHLEALHPLPFPWNVSCAHHSRTENHFKDAALREKCFIETT